MIKNSRIRVVLFLLIFFVLSKNVDLKESMQCKCYMLGTHEDTNGLSICDQDTGQCKCYKNVDGIKCEQCRENYFGLLSMPKKGCTFCGCDLHGSITQKCDSETGQCTCKDGYTGYKCNECIKGFYKHQNNTCEKSKCYNHLTNRFSQENGSCICINNAEGENCDRCKINFIYKKGVGCVKCLKCYDLIHTNLNNFIKELDLINNIIIDKSVNTNANKFNKFNNRFNKLKRLVNELFAKQDQIVVLNYTKIDDLLKILNDFKFDKLQSNALNLNKPINKLDKNIKKASDLKKIALEALKNAQESNKNINEHNSLMDDLLIKANNQSEIISNKSDDYIRDLHDMENECKNACIKEKEFNEDHASNLVLIDELKSNLENVAKKHDENNHKFNNINPKIKFEKKRAVDMKKNALDLKDALDMLKFTNLDNFYEEMSDIRNKFVDVEKMDEQIMLQLKAIEYAQLEFKGKDVLTLVDKLLKALSDYEEKLKDLDQIYQINEDKFNDLQKNMAELDKHKTNYQNLMESEYGATKNKIEIVKNGAYDVEAQLKFINDTKSKLVLKNIYLNKEFKIVKDQMKMYQNKQNQDIEKLEIYVMDSSEILLKMEAELEKHTQTLEELKSYENVYVEETDKMKTMILFLEGLPLYKPFNHKEFLEAEEEIKELEDKMKYFEKYKRLQETKNYLAKEVDAILELINNFPSDDVKCTKSGLS